MTNNRYRLLEAWFRVQKLWTGSLDRQASQAAHAQLDELIATSNPPENVTKITNAKQKTNFKRESHDKNT